MKTINVLLISTLLLTVNGCSKDYSPEENATAESMYQTACAECHKKDSSGMIFTFDSQKANTAYINERIANGNMMMPKFPNIKGEQLKQLSDYILKNSNNKE